MRNRLAYAIPLEPAAGLHSIDCSVCFYPVRHLSLIAHTKVLDQSSPVMLSRKLIFAAVKSCAVLGVPSRAHH